MKGIEGSVMSNQDFVQFLRAVHEAELQQAPTQHRLKTPDCPPLSRWNEYNWTVEEQAHMSDCAYCQKVQAMYDRAK